MTVINHRLYLPGFTPENDNDPVTKKGGIAVYSKCLGVVLRCFQIAEKIQVKGKCYYVNKQSYAKWKLRHPGLVVESMLPINPKGTLQNLKQISRQVLESNTLTSKEKKQILADYGIGMIDALGGIDKVINLPVVDMKKWNGTLDPKQFTGPIVRGKLNEEPILIFCYVPYDRAYIKGDYLRRKKEDQRWICGGRGIRGELDFAMGSDGVPPGSEIEKQMFDRIRRLTSGLPVGRIQSYNESVIRVIKDNLPIPKNAYLKGHSLEEFMKLDTDYYEMDPADEGARLTLFTFK